MVRIFPHDVSRRKITLYHNSRCSKSRGALEILTNAGAQVEIVEYLTPPPTAETLDALLKMLALEPEQIVRRGEDEFTALGYDKTPPLDRAAWIEALVKTPILIERPIITNGRKAVIGRPPERALEILKD